jgi:tetratricopeptide (TPR) repeat protein
VTNCPSWEEAREFLEPYRATFTELGHKEALGTLPFSMRPLELRAGNPVPAERELRAGLELFQEMGERAPAGSLAAMLAGTLAEQGRLDEADEYLEVALGATGNNDVSGLAQAKISAARVRARRGEKEEAVRLAAEAVAFMVKTEEFLNMPDLLMWRAEVLELAGRVENAKVAVSKAADIAARKGALVDEQRRGSG